MRIRLYLEDGRDISDAEDSMSEMPARQKAFLFPKEVVFARFGLGALPHQRHSKAEQTRSRVRPVRFTGTTPILRVNSLGESIAHYVSVLGFTHEWDDGQFGCVSRGNVEIFLCEGSQGCARTWIYVSVSDADALFDEYSQKGVHIRRSPVNYPWGAREMHAFDLDGHVLRFGSDAIPGEAWGGWIDEHGIRWQPQSDGSWVRGNPEVLN